MIEKITNIVLIVASIFMLQSCGSTKTATQASKKSTSTAGKSNGSSKKAEYNAFFKAETERIKGNKKQARTLYREFVKRFKSNGAAYYNLSKLEFRSFNFKDAEEYAARSVELSPKNKYYLEHFADVLSLNKKPKKAVGIYEQLTGLYKENADTYRYKMYKIYSDLDEYDKAYKTLDLLEQNWGVSPEITMQKVDLLLKQKKDNLAIETVKKLVETEPRNAEYKENLASLYDKLGRKEEAKKMYEALIDDAPNDTRLLMRSSSYYLRNKDTVGFQNVLKKIVANPKIDESIRMSMLLPLIEINNDTSYIKSDILPLVKSMKAEGGGDGKSAKMYADVLYSARQYAPAAAAYREYLKIDQSKFAVWFNMMLCHSNLNQLDSVIAIADESFDYFPNNAFTHYFKGTAEYQKKEYAASIKSLQSAIDLEPERDLKAQIFSMMGDAYHSLEDYKKSDEKFEAAIKIKEDASTLNNYAYYLSIRNERLEDALKMSEKSLKLMPDTKTFLDTYGWILFKQGDYKKAKIYIEKAIEGDGDADADVLEHLGDIYYKLNDESKAKEYWQRAKKVGGGGSKMLDKKIEEGKYYE